MGSKPETGKGVCKTVINKVSTAFAKFIEWPEYSPLVIILGACVANLGKGDSINLLVVGPPSSGKTEALRSLGSQKYVYELSKLTARTLVSGYIKKNKAPGRDKSLLIQLKNEGKSLLVIKDLTSILSSRVEERAEIFGQFREIADGYYNQPFGTGEEVRWKGKLGVIAGVTGTIDESFAMRQSLGERFLQVRLSMGSLDRIMEKALETTGKEEQLRKEFQGIVNEFLSKLCTPDLDAVSINPSVQLKLFHLAHFVSLGRTGVRRNPYTKILTSFPESEGPSRLVKQLALLGKGIAVCCGKGEVDEEIYCYLKRVGKDTIPMIREKCLARIWRDELESCPSQTTTALSNTLNCSKDTIRTWLEDLKEVGLLAKETTDDGALWSLSGGGFELVMGSEVYSSKEIEGLIYG